MNSRRRGVKPATVSAVKSWGSLLIPAPRPVGRILRAMALLLPRLEAMTISSPVCKSFSLTTLLGFLDFRNSALCRARSFRSR